MHRWDETAPFLSEVLFSDVVTLDAFRALAATARVQDAIEIATPEAADLLGAPRSGSRSGCSARPVGRDRASDHERGATPTRGASRGTEPTDRRHRRSPAHRRGPRAKCGIGSGRAVARVARGSGRGEVMTQATPRAPWLGGMSPEDLEPHLSAWKLRAPSVVSHEEFMLVVKDVDFDEDTIVAWRDLLAEHGVTLDERVEELDHREVLRDRRARGRGHRCAWRARRGRTHRRRGGAATTAAHDVARPGCLAFDRLDLRSRADVPQGDRPSPAADRPRRGEAREADRGRGARAAPPRRGRPRERAPAAARRHRRRVREVRADPGEPAARRVDREALRRAGGCSSSTSSRRATSA